MHQALGGFAVEEGHPHPQPGVFRRYLKEFQFAIVGAAFKAFYKKQGLQRFRRHLDARARALFFHLHHPRHVHRLVLQRIQCHRQGVEVAFDQLSVAQVRHHFELRLWTAYHISELSKHSAHLSIGFSQRCLISNWETEWGRASALQ